MSKTGSPPTPPPPDGSGPGSTSSGSQGEFTCFFCGGGVRGPDGQMGHAEGCEQARIDAERARMQAERARQAPQPSSPSSPASPATPAAPGGTGGTGPRQPLRGTDGTPVGGGGFLRLTPPGGTGGTGDQAQRASQEEVEARLTPQQREALRSLRLGKEQQAWREAGKRREDVEVPPWLRDLLEQQGVPDGFFQEFRAGTGLPDPTLIPTPPGGDEAMMPFHPRPDPLITAWWQALRTFEAFYDGLSEEAVEGTREQRRNLGRAYVEAGAIYGPTEAGMLQWAGEVTQMQRNIAKTEEIARRQQLRAEVNARFPRFWRGEWEVPGQSPAASAPPAPPAPPEQGATGVGDAGSIIPDAQPQAQPQAPAEAEAPAPDPTDIDTSWMHDNDVGA